MILYKYVSLSSKKVRDRIFSSIQSQKLWFADWKTFNDPLEGRFYIDCGDVESSDIKILDKKSDAVIQIKSKFSVLCGAKRWDNSLLWALYTDGHKGLVIEFEIIEHEEIYYKYKGIEYVRKIPSVKVGENDQENAEAVLYCKGHEYSPEEEHRILREAPQGLNDIRIRSIYFGIRCSRLFIKKIQGIRLNNVLLYKVKQGIHYDLLTDEIRPRV